MARSTLQHLLSNNQESGSVIRDTMPALTLRSQSQPHPSKSHPSKHKHNELNLRELTVQRVGVNSKHD